MAQVKPHLSATHVVKMSECDKCFHFVVTRFEVFVPKVNPSYAYNDRCERLVLSPTSKNVLHVFIMHNRFPLFVNIRIVVFD